MLSKDEIDGGMTFILRLWDAVGDSTQWVETLRGDVARRWYEIHRSSDWEALRGEAAGVFHNRVTDDEAAKVLKSQSRCIYIHTQMVEAGEVAELAGTTGEAAFGGTDVGS